MSGAALAPPPDWVAVATAALLLIGAAATLVAAVGLARWNSFFERAHAPGVVATGGLFAVALASALYFTALEGRPSTHEALLLLFVWATTPVSLSLLARVDVHRERRAARGARDEEKPLSGA